MFNRFLCVNGVHSRKHIAAGICLALTAAPAPAFADNLGDAARHDQVITAIAYNFTRFIQWRNQPEDAAPPNLVFCVLDADASQAWTEIDGKAVGDRRIELHLARDASTERPCDIAYVSEELQKSVSLEEMARSGVVTISDAESFIRNGGAIALVVSDKSATFEIDEQTLRRAGARVSSKLMRVGMRVSLSK